MDHVTLAVSLQIMIKLLFDNRCREMLNPGKQTTKSVEGQVIPVDDTPVGLTESVD